MRLREATTKYLQSREFNGYAPNTVRNDRRALHKIDKILGDIPLLQFNDAAFDKVMAHEQSRGLGVGSINNIITTGRTFTQWCQSRGLMAPDQNPASRRYLKQAPKMHDYLPRHMFTSLLDAATSPRDRIILAMGLYTLARTSEIQAVTIKDVDLSTGYVRMIVQKSYDSDLVPMSNELDRELRRWLTTYAEECGPLQPDWLLIPGSKTTGYQMVTWNPEATLAKPEDAVKRALQPLGWKFTGRTGMHLLRRSSARAMFDTLVEAGYDGALRRVQTWLHHANMGQTEQYIGVSLDRDQRDRETIGRDMFPTPQSTPLKSALRATETA